MASVTVYNLTGKETGTKELDDSVFAVTVRPQAVRMLVNSQRANAALPYAHTKDRSEVRGGGKKPWRQKGTGRARHGSSRSPIWRGGGVTFGPLFIRNQAKKINKKARQSALRMVLTDKLQNNGLIVVDSFAEVSGKTKELATALQSLPVAGATSLIATAEAAPLLTRAGKNMPTVNTVLAQSLNVTDVLRYRYLVCDTAAVDSIVAWLKK